MKTRTIYLDYQATTPVDQLVLRSMSPFFIEDYGNPHSEENLFGQRAAAAVVAARGQIADLIGARPREIVFTSGATEANNLAILGLARRMEASGRRHIITAMTEHKSVLEPIRHLESQGVAITWLPVEANGLVTAAAVAAALRDDTGLVSIMAANNEIGVLQPISEIGQMCRGRGVVFHTDAAQAVGKVPLDVSALNADLLSLSGHKVYGPKGIGALYVRHGLPVKPEPLMWGGGQEGGLRPGTLPPALCVGLGQACALAAELMESERARLLELRGQFLDQLRNAGVAFEINGDIDARLPGNLNVSFEDVDSEALLMTTREEVALATGSACTANSIEPSYVVEALGFGRERAESAVRIGFGRFTTSEQVAHAAAVVASAVTKLRRLSYRPTAAAQKG